MDTTTLVAALLHDTVEDTRYTLQRAARRLRPRGRPPGRRGDQVRQGVLRRRRRGRDHPQDDHRGRQGRPGPGHQARRPAAQHAHPRRPLRRLPGPDRPGHPGGAGAAVRPARHPGAQARTRGRVLRHLEPEAHARIDRHVANRPEWTAYLRRRGQPGPGGAATRTRSTPRSSPAPGTTTRSGRTPSPAGTPTRSTCPASWSWWTARRPTATPRSARSTARGGRSRAVQGLHRLAEEQPLPLAAHHRHRPGRPHRRGADPHRGDAPLRGVRHRRRLPLPRARRQSSAADGQRRRQLDWLQPGARLAARRRPTRRSSSSRCAATSPRRRSRSSPRAGRSCCPPAPPRSTWRTSSAPERGDHCLAATVNGRLAPLVLRAGRRRRGGDLHRDRPDGELRRSTAARPGPRREWLDFVRTPHAQLQINRWFAEHQETGHLDRRQGPARPGHHRAGAAQARPRPGQRPAAAARLAEELGYPDLETLLVAVVDRTLDPDNVVEQLIAHGRPSST